MTAALKTTDREAAPRPPVRCTCGHLVFDGLAVKARVVLLDPAGGKAKCRCKRWVSVPVAYAP